VSVPLTILRIHFTLIPDAEINRKQVFCKQTA